MDVLGIHYAQWHYIISAPLFIIAVILCVRYAFTSRKNIFLLVDKKHLKKLFPGFSPVRIILKSFLWCCGIIALLLALLRPQWNKKEQTVTQEGRDVMIVLDVSRSMLAHDMVPSRLENAKLKIRSLLDMLSFERVGLILFSGSAYIQCPLTADHAAFLTFLKHVDAETISSGTTALDKAFLKTMEAFGGASSDRKHKLMVLLTDGEDFSANFGPVKTKAREQNMTVFAVGLGSPEGAPIPIVNEYGKQVGHETDKDGKPILSVLNEDLLSGVCSALGGTYVRATQDDSDLDVIVAKINQFEKEKFEDRSFTSYEDKYVYFVASAFLFLLLEWLL